MDASLLARRATGPGRLGGVVQKVALSSIGLRTVLNASLIGGWFPLVEARDTESDSDHRRDSCYVRRSCHQTGDPLLQHPGGIVTILKRVLVLVFVSLL